MKKFITAVFTLLMTLIMLPVVPVCASANEGWNGDVSASKFIDNADLFTDAEEAEINRKVQETAEELEMNILILAAGYEYYMSDEQTEVFSDNSYDTTYGVDTDGVFFFMDFTGKKPAYDYISPSGKAMVYYKENIDSISDEVHFYLPSSDSDYTQYTDDIMDGIYCFLGQLSEYYGSDSSYYDENSDRYYYIEDGGVVTTRSKPLAVRLKALIFAIPIGVIAGLIFFFATKHHYKFKTSANPNVYVSNEYTRFTHREDRFIRTYTTKTKIETSSGGSRSGGGGGRGGGGHR
ncbi:MAG: hypothetical protein IKV85_04405 [Ruminococcus sp.]|nr:hypothetical protein [Ruminococcus sp.]